MKKHLKFIDGASDKFWQIETNGLLHTVTYGKNGTGGSSKSKSFATEEECLAAAEKLVAEKLKKGYSENGEVFAAPKAATVSGKTKDTALLLEKYDDIVRFKRRDEILPFLKENARGNIDVLKKQIKKNKRFWLTFTDLKDDPVYRPKNSYHWGTRGDEHHSEIITLSALAIFNAADVASWQEVFTMLNKAEEPIVAEALEFAKPKWIEGFLLDRLRKEDWAYIDYKTLRYLEDKGFIQHNPELYTMSLARFTTWNAKMKGRDFIEFIVNDPVAYNRDVPELFNYETAFYAPSFREEDNTEYHTWSVILKRLLDDGKLDRAGFIEKGILAQTKEWNNNLKSFFRKKIDEINATPDELIVLQENIFAALHNVFPPVTRHAVELIKKIYDHPKFDSASFLQWLEPLMMRSDCAAAVKAVLPVLEKLNKLKPKLNRAIVMAVSEIFLIPDMGVQEKAAKLINKIGKKNDEPLKDKLSSYVSLIHGNVKQSLYDFTGEAEAGADLTGSEEKYSYSPVTVNVLKEEVVLPKDWNEILYLFGRFIASDDMLESERLINVYITQRHLFPSDYNTQLQPYAKQLENTYFDALYKAYMSVFLQQKIYDINYGFRIKENKYDRVNTTKLLGELLHAAQERMDAKVTSPLLCFPTHAPHWVAPEVLVLRLRDVQQRNEKVNWADLSIAISRMPRENTDAAIKLLDGLKGELKELMAFCLGVSDKISFKEESAFSKMFSKLSTSLVPENIGTWATAARTFYPGRVFEIFNQTHLKDVPFAAAPFNPVIEHKARWSEWTNHITNEKEKSPIWYEIGFDLPDYKRIPVSFLYGQDMWRRKKTWGYELNSAGNVYSWAGVTPQNLDALAWYLMGTTCVTADGSKTELKGFMDVISRDNARLSHIVLLVFATCFFVDKKDIRMQASEVLINLIEKQTVDIVLLGGKLAELASFKYGAFARMADSVNAIKDVSPLHNSALMIVLDTIISKVEPGEKLPVNFKKLVEHYIDVMYKTNSTPGEEAIAFLKKWEGSSLKPLIKKILK